MLQPGETIDIWVVETALGSGGMGSVYRCHNRSAGRILAAIKVLEGGLKRYPEAEARFVREAEILFQLDHPNIVKVRNIRTETDPPYLEMEFVAGEALDERMARGPIPYVDTLRMLTQVTDAIRYLHERGIRHRDIKPANLLVQRDGKVKLVDFGLAVESDHTRITQQGMAFGTVSYAPPEWITPDTMDPVKWDLYALGVVFYEMLTGRLAFPVSGQGTARQQAMQVIVAKQGHAPLDPGDNFHDDVRLLIGRMTAPDPAQRTGDAAEVLEAMRGLRPELRRAMGATLAPTGSVPIDTGSAPSMDTNSVYGPPPPSAPVRPAIARTTPLSIPTRRIPTAALAFGGIGAFLMGMVLVVSVGGAGLWWLTRPPPDRELRVVAAGVDPERLDVDLSTGQIGRVDTDGARSFSSVVPGQVRVSWAAGPGCDAAACSTGSCEPWCTHGEEVVAVEPGADAFVVELAPALPVPRSIEFGLPAGAEVATSSLDGAAGARTPAGLSFSDVVPGPHQLSVALAGCPDGDASCRVVDLAVTVPVEGPPEPPSLALTAPAAPSPSPSPAAPAPRPGRGLVKAAALREWVASDPAARVGWPDLEGASGEARGVPPMLARAYCESLGRGLARETDPPAPANFEIRIRNHENPYWTFDESGPVAPVRPDQSMTAIGGSFRCR